ncbi:molybdenum cofactor biosynthetic protein [Ophiostoma piceae UAMH 11346]|uniref:Adenylyltransferase and sulfurtransferase uba4 n=1 Tax=Ophiostoma piceae (strain UAMH 11346) TaxID=1262450 RepID=S3CD73_OPHP1|nr:molybdenum cofactor biosynthetic protein [Ophiostoma piceae UAMH 11346]
MSADLRRRIAAAEAGLQGLRDQLARAEAEERKREQDEQTQDKSRKWPLEADEYDRYARQLILPGVGVAGQLCLKRASVVVIGAGGLGCPAATYLAGAGIGCLTLVDGDTVEISNLHRQIAHTTGRVGQYKVDSLAAALRQSNPTIRIQTHKEHITPQNASTLITSAVTLVLDCSDHPSVRYLVSDACVRARVPLVSAAALRTDGQLTVLNNPPGAGPCYRCVFPRPPPAASQTSCAEGGVLGPVVGVMGVLQALEGIRVLVNSAPTPPTLLLFSSSSGGALGAPTLRTVRLKGKRADCYACGTDAPLQKLRSLEDVNNAGSSGEREWPDYVQFCGGSTAVTQHILQPSERVSVQDFAKVLSGVQSEDKSARPYWLLDVREREFYDMGSIDGATNVPFSQTQSHSPSAQTQDWLPPGMADGDAPIYLVCRVGNDSQVVTRRLKELGLDRGGARFVGDIQGGILAWKRSIDPTMPFV